MYWHEARLFACYYSPNFFSNKTIITYELSSSTQVVTWKWILEDAGWKATAEPTTTFEEHQAQMQALCEIVVAKTGLRLYDLDRGKEVSL